MPPNPTGRKADEPGSDRLSQSAGTTDYEHKSGYGADTAWANIFWTITGILCACGLAVFLLMR
jgi:hypothetical protein